MKKLLNKIILENGLGKIDTFNSLADTIENSLFESDFKSLTSALRMFIEGVLREYKKEHQENLKPSTVQKLFLDEYIRLGILAKGFEKTNDLLDVLNSPQHFKNFTGFFNFTMERAEDVLIKFVKSINELFNTHYKIPHVEYRDQAEEGFKKVSTSIVSFQNVKNWKMIIPQFQRDYVWGVDKIRELLMGEEDFIGNIVVSYKNGKYHVIDGQQRILTLLSALKINDKENKFDIKAEYGRSDVIDFVSGNKNKKPFYDIDIDINKLDKKYFNLLLVPYEESYKYFEIMNISGHELTPAEKATALMITSLKNVSSSVKNGLRSLIIEDRNFTDEMLKEFRVDISEGDINKLLEANFVHKMFLGTLEHKIGKKMFDPQLFLIHKRSEEN